MHIAMKFVVTLGLRTNHTPSVVVSGVTVLDHEEPIPMLRNTFVKSVGVAWSYPKSTRQ